MAHPVAVRCANRVVVGVGDEVDAARQRLRARYGPTLDVQFALPAVACAAGG